MHQHFLCTHEQPIRRTKAGITLGLLHERSGMNMSRLSLGFCFLLYSIMLSRCFVLSSWGRQEGNITQRSLCISVKTGQ